MGTPNHAMRLVRKTATGLASVYYCPFCKNPKASEDAIIIFRNGVRGVGKGHGLRSGAIGTSKVAAHIRRAHPEEVAKAAELTPGN